MVFEFIKSAGLQENWIPTPSFNRNLHVTHPLRLRVYTVPLPSGFEQSLRYTHPRRPRDSQSGREKRRDESFQVRAKEPLGTDSHQTISKNSSRCRLLIRHKKCFVLLCPIGEQFLLSSFDLFSWRLFKTRQTCLVRSPSLCVQGKLLFSTCLTRYEGTPDESKKRLGCYQ